MDSPITWASEKLISLMGKESSRLKPQRESVSDSFNLRSNKIVQEDLNNLAVPEILSAQYCILSGNSDLLKISPPLQAFIVYAISLYDVITDNHLENPDGKPSFLKKYGKEPVLLAEKKYQEVIYSLSKDMDRYIPNAHNLALEIYKGTLDADKERNRKLYGSIDALAIQKRIAGDPAYKIAILSNAPELGEFSSSLVNGITTLEDIIDLFEGRDFTGNKTTIPLSYLGEEFGYIPHNFKVIKKSDSIKKSRDYVSKELHFAESILSEYNDSFGKSLLLKTITDAKEFNSKFPEGYL